MLDINKFKNILKEEESEVFLQLQSMAQLDQGTGVWDTTPSDVDGPESDSNDMADRFEDFEEKSSIVSSLSARYKDITDALQKIEENKYGICEVSGKEIEEDRLEANPAARTCKEFMNN
jgi:RNA polymerase-binding transcription factor DksA